jgi:hypothetical protein
MRFYRVFGGDEFGGPRPKINGKPTNPQVGDTLKGVFATPHLSCVAQMVAWCDDHATCNECEGNSVVLEIEATEWKVPTKTEKTGHNVKTDLDEVIIIEGTVVKVWEPRDLLRGLPYPGLFSIMSWEEK